mgnify:CR=1 FL=1
MQGGTAIQNGDDMDNYKSPGSYYLALTNDISSLKNAPNFTSAFTMKVEYGNGMAYPCQIYTECTTGRKAFRYFNTTYNTWQPYVYFSDDATLFAGKAINSGDDLNDYILPGIYYSGSSSITTSLLNIPETFSAGFSMLVLPISTTMRIQIIYRGGSENSMYVRPFINDWGSWSKYIGTVISS